MPSAKIGKQAAAYPPGYRVPSLVRLAVYAPAARSRAFRRFFWGRPVSRWRTYIVGSCFHVLVRRLGESDFSFLTTVWAGELYAKRSACLDGRNVRSSVASPRPRNRSAR